MTINPHADVALQRTSVARIALIALIMTVGVATQGVFNPLQELVKAQLNFSDFQISLLQGLAAALPVALLSMPIGRLCDRGNRVRLLLVMAFIWTLGAVLSAIAHSFTLLFIARAMAAVGVLCGLPVSISLAADLSANTQRGFAMLLLSVGRIVGAALAFALGGALIGALASHPAATFGGIAPWRIVHALFAACSLLLIVPLFLLREPARHELGDVIDPSPREAARAIWQRRALLGPIFLGQVTVTMTDAAAGVWGAPVLTRDYHLQPEQFGVWMGLVILLSGLGGAIVGGVLADLGHKGKIRGGILGPAAVASVIAIPAACFPIMPSVAGFVWMLTLLLISGAITGLVTATAIAVLVPNELRGVCLGAFMVIGSVFGLGVAPTLVSLTSVLLGGEAHLREALTIVGVFSSVVAAAGFIAAMRASPDRQAHRSAACTLDGDRSS
jgi:MFS family permease